MLDPSSPASNVEERKVFAADHLGLTISTIADPAPGAPSPRSPSTVQSTPMAYASAVAAAHAGALFVREPDRPEPERGERLVERVRTTEYNSGWADAGDWPLTGRSNQF